MAMHIIQTGYTYPFATLDTHLHSGYSKPLLSMYMHTKHPVLHSRAHLISQSEQCSEKSSQVHLSGTQLPPTRVVGAVQGSSTVYYQQRVPAHTEREVGQ